ncbi:MAG: diguanylate cyclase [Proteobacteria bacterium]|nr:diguanylate cyclase [Pseudomonadota bacterium]
MENKILIVEDDAVIAKLMYEFLSRSGYQAITTHSAEEAEKILLEEEIHIILTDIKLPGTDGITFTKNVKKQYNLDVIITTGYSAEYFYEDAINNGASDLIFKPIRLNELMLRINRVIRERSLINERDKMIERLKKLSIRDPLTELYNSRHFYGQLEDEIQRSERYLHPLSLIFIDIDNFKTINDTYGHMVGDQALLLIAKKMQTSLRSQDTAYRFAGDEFTIILPETTSDNAKFVADRIKSEMEKESLVILEQEITKITLSIGIAEYQRNEKKEQFVHRADVTMYEAKKKGGNNIAVSSKLAALSNDFKVESAAHNI